MTEKKMLIAIWPRLCDDCGKETALKASDRADLNVITVYCPHQQTLAMAYCGEVEGKRAIFRWDIQGPVPESEALDIIGKLGAASATFENLDAPRLN